ncbi:MAG TPA: YggT family protein [Pyrinomonadaceae bacterium]|nr:YggT family protein [Pyrinomonadaceae bacterium]
MLVISRAFLFFSWAIQLAIVAIIALMILRLIGDAADLNPFGWASRTLRRLTDGFIVPVRGSLRQVGVDPKFAPLVVILVTILLGFFLMQLIATLATTLSGVITSVQAGELFSVLGFILYGLISLYILMIFVRIIFSWGMVSYTNRLMRFLVDATEPLLGPLRRIIPPLGRMDISPIIAFLILWLFQQAIAGTLLRGQTPIAF